MKNEASLRRHNPDQVLRVEGYGPPLSPAHGLPVGLLRALGYCSLKMPNLQPLIGGGQGFLKVMMMESFSKIRARIARIHPKD
jgi:hypothetical protein